jgi:hypothetical protein
MSLYKFYDASEIYCSMNWRWAENERMNGLTDWIAEMENSNWITDKGMKVEE